MSEIKGQLLGVLLVIALFGTLAVAMKSVFSNQTKNIEGNVNNIVDTSKTSTSMPLYSYYN